MVALAAALRLQPWWHSGANPFLVLLESGLVSAVGLGSLWRFALSAEEREKFGGKLAARLSRRAGGRTKGQPA